jgi:hypothetical protein
MTGNTACLCLGKIKRCGRCGLLEIARARAEEKAREAAAQGQPGRWPSPPPRRTGG